MHIRALLPVVPLIFCVFMQTGRAQIYPVKQNGKWGFMDTSGAIVIAPVYDKAMNPLNGIAHATLSGDYYLISANGNTIRIPDCSRFQILTPDVGKAFRKGLWWLTDLNGNTLSEKGYQRLWLNPLDSQRVFISEGDKTGLMHTDGSVIFETRYHNLRCLTPGIYYSKNPVGYGVVSENKNPLNGRTFLHLGMVSPQTEMLLLTDELKTMHLFSKEGEEVMKGSRISAMDLGNQFVHIRQGSRSVIYDQARKVFIDSLKGDPGPSEIAECFEVDDQGSIKVFHRTRGFIFEGDVYLEDVPPPGSIRPIIFRKNYFYGLMDQNYRMVLQPVYQSIDILDSRRFVIKDSTFYLGIFNFTSGKWEHSMPYISVTRGKQLIKGFAAGNLMDYMKLDSSGNITEVNTLKNVYHTEINRRNFGTDNPFGNGNFISTFRSTGWYLKQERLSANQTLYLYGLRKYDSATGRWNILIRPVFMQVKVLKSFPLSIASFTNSNKATGILFAGERHAAIPPTASYLVNDETGKKLTGLMEFIDEFECDDTNAPDFRAFHMGKMYLILKSTIKPRTVCLYASGYEYGVRRVYSGGKFKLENPKFPSAFTIRDNYLFNSLGFTNRRQSRQITTEGGEWKLLTRDGKYFKPTIAGSGKISHMNPFVEGKSIVMLDNGKWGVIDTAGNTFIPADYDYITTQWNMPGYYFCGYHSYKYGLVNSSGEMILPPAFHTISKTGSVYYGKVGDSGAIISVNGGISALKPVEKPTGFENDYGFIRRKKGYELVQQYGSERTGLFYKNVTAFHNGYAAVKDKGFWGLIDAEGHWILNPRYQNAKSFGYTAGIFEKGQRWRFVTPEGEVIQGPRRAHAFAEIAPEIYVYKNGERMGIFNVTGKKICSFRFLETPFVYNDYIIGTVGSRIYFFSLQGEKLGVLPGQIRGGNRQITHQTSQRYFSRHEDYTVGFTSGQMRAFGADSPWADIKVPISLSGRGNLQREFVYEAACNDVYLTSGRGYSALFNGSGESLVSTSMYTAEPMQNGLSVCAPYPLKFGLLDRYGFWVVPPEYADIKRLDSQTFSFRIAYDYHIYNPGGQKLLDETVDVYNYTNGLLQLRQGNRLGYYKPGRGIIRLLQE